MKAIQTRFLGPTDYKPSRIKAFDCAGNSRTYNMHYNVDCEHRIAAETFIKDMGWNVDILGGGTIKGKDMVWVIV